VKAFGSKNLYSASTVDQMPKHVSSGYLFGNAGAIPVPDLDRTDYLLMLGANPFESNGSLCTAPDFPGSHGRHSRARRPYRRRRSTPDQERRRRRRAHRDPPGLRRIVAGGARQRDPDCGSGRRGSAIGRTIDRWRRPSAHRSRAVHRRGGGHHTRSADAETTRRIAREFAEAPTAVCLRTDRHPHHRVRNAGILAGRCAQHRVTGNLDRPGGAMFPRPAHGRPANEAAGEPRPGGRGFSTGRWTSRVGGHPEVRGEMPVAALAEEIETDGPGKVRALITSSGNPVRSCPELRAPRRSAGVARVHGVGRHLRQRDDPTRRRDPPLPVTARQAALRPGVHTASRSATSSTTRHRHPPGRPPRASPGIGRLRDLRHTGADRVGARDPTPTPAIVTGR
jgi:hypothetical protein